MRLEIAKNEAKTESTTKNIPIAICEDLAIPGEYYRLDARVAYRDGHRIADVVSPHPGYPAV